MARGGLGRATCTSTSQRGEPFTSEGVDAEGWFLYQQKRLMNAFDTLPLQKKRRWGANGKELVIRRCGSGEMRLEGPSPFLLVAKIRSSDMYQCWLMDFQSGPPEWPPDSSTPLITGDFLFLADLMFARLEKNKPPTCFDLLSAIFGRSASDVDGTLIYDYASVHLVEMCSQIVAYFWGGLIIEPGRLQ
jgi:hypothetical protein